MNSSVYKKYSTAFTAGALLLSETEVAINSLSDYNNFLRGKEDLNVMILPINAESSRKRVGAEIIKRLRALPDSSFIDLFSYSNAENKKILLFYSICKYYPIILDFMIEVVLTKWNNLDVELTVEDFQNFLFLKMDYHPELVKITDKTKYKSGQVALKMLKELGMLVDGKLHRCEYSLSVMKAISKVGDTWFLDIIFLNNMEKENLLKHDKY